MEILDLDDFGDYRDLLLKFYLKRKAEMPLFSYRMLGQKLNLDTTQIFRIIQKEYHLPTRCIPLAKDLLGLAGRSGECFELLVAASRTKSVQKKNELIHKALALRDVDRHKLKGNEIKFLNQWWVPVVRSYIEISGGKANVDEMVSRITPQITHAQVKEAIEILLDLGFIRKISSERYIVEPTHFTIGGSEKSVAIRNYQKQMIELSQTALNSIPMEERDFSTLTVTVDNECYQDLKEMAREFRRQIQKRAEEVKISEQVIQINLSLFPLIASKGREK